MSRTRLLLGLCVCVCVYDENLNFFALLFNSYKPRERPFLGRTHTHRELPFCQAAPAAAQLFLLERESEPKKWKYEYFVSKVRFAFTYRWSTDSLRCKTRSQNQGFLFHEIKQENRNGAKSKGGTVWEWESAHTHTHIQKKNINTSIIPSVSVVSLPCQKEK